MRKSHFTLVELIVVLGFLFLFFIIPWPMNAYRLFQCDFDSKGSWKGEIVHGIGLFTPTYIVTAWSNWDEK